MTGPGIYSYSTTPASNVQANTGINWDEGMPPASVNNSARQNMTDLRNAFNDLIWFKYGKGDLDYSPVYVAATQFKIAGADVTTQYHVGRRVKAVGSGTGTIYGRISVTAFSTDTTVTVVWDSGSLSNETLTIYLSQAPVTGKPLALACNGDYVEGTWTPIDSSGASLSLTSVAGIYTRIGRVVYFEATLAFPSTVSGATATIGGLPYTSANLATFTSYICQLILIGGSGHAAASTAEYGVIAKNGTTISLAHDGGTSFTNANLSTYTVVIKGNYTV